MKSANNPMRSLLRLAVGSMIMGVDELDRQLKLWQAAADAADAQQRQTESTNAERATLPLSQADASEPPLVAQPTPRSEEPAETVRHAVIGLLFDTQQRLEQGMTTLERADRLIGGMAEPLVRAAQTSSVLAPVRERFDELAARGEAEVSRWAAIGRVEETRSQQLTKTAVQMSFETSVHQVAVNPEIQELVQKQGTGLALEVVEEVRERAVSADTLIERVTRSLLKRAPREDLPEPPVAVQLKAEHIRSTEE